MNELRFTLITDGSSDIALMNVVKWLLDDLYPELPNIGKHANFTILPDPPKTSEVQKRLNFAKEYYPFDILIYHRDAESIDINIISQRIQEIKNQVLEENKDLIVCVVPVKMMETWLLINDEAIKKASGNRGYKGNMNLPNCNKLEKIQDPKQLLHSILKETSGLKSRRLKKFNVHEAVHLVAENIENFSILRELNSFLQFEKDLKIAVDNFIGIQFLD